MTADAEIYIIGGLRLGCDDRCYIFGNVDAMPRKKISIMKMKVLVNWFLRFDYVESWALLKIEEKQIE